MAQVYQSDFHITLTSDSSRPIYNDNKPSCFKIKHEPEIRLNGEWEMAIIDLHYPHNWNNFDYETEIITYLNGDDQDLIELKEYESASSNFEILVRDYATSINKNELTFRKCLLHSDYYANATELCEQICDTLNAEYEFQSNADMLKFIYSRVTNRVLFTSELERFHVFTNKPDIFVSLGFEVVEVADRVYSVNLYEQALNAPCIPTIDTIYIYCSLLHYQIVGSVTAPLLGMLPVQAKPGTNGYWSFPSRTYIKIDRSLIDSIDIQLRDDQGDLIPFRSNGRVVCRLHFRRRQLTI